MFDHSTHLPAIFANFNDSFMSSNSFITPSLPLFSFDTGSPFDRLLPLSTDEPFADISFSRLVTNDFNIPATGVVRNIPIKIERECDSTTQTSSVEPYFLSEEYKNKKVQKSAPNRPTILTSYSSPPSPPQRKFVNTYQAESPSFSSFSASSSDDDKRTRTTSATPVPKLDKLSNRPAIAPKPKNLVASKSFSKDKKESDYDRPNGEDENVFKVAWRLAELAAPLENQSDAPPWSRQIPKNLEVRNKDQENTNNLLKGLEGLCNDDMGSSSPSSSGIVADASDSLTDYPQSSSHLSERDSAYDYPRARGDVLTKFGNSVPAHSFHQPEKSSTFFTSLSSNGDRYGSLIEDVHSLPSNMQPQSMQSSPSVSQNVFDGTDRSLDKVIADADPSSFNSFYNATLRAKRLPNVSSTSSAGTNQGSAYSWQDKTPIDSKSKASSLRNEWNPHGDGGSASKRAVCVKLSDSFRLLDMNIKSIDECTAPQAWRQPHILQRNLLNIKESTETVVTALGDFLDASSRIAIDPANSKIDDLKRLLNPLRNSYSLVAQLKQNIDHIGWTLAALARPKNKAGVAVGNDALDQFVAVVKQVPADCSKMLQWALTLIPSTTVRFLVSSKNQLTSNCNSFGAYSMQNTDILKRLSDLDNSSDDSKRCSLTSTITASSSSDVQTPSTIRSRSSFSNSVTNQNLTPQPNGARNSDCGLSSLEKPENNGHIAGGNGESRVIEEDDLESVLSDRESLLQDYALVGDDINNAFRKRPLTNGPPSVQLSSELTSTLSEDDRQLLRFYAPQLESHIDFLSRAIEEFLSIVEEQLPPREFVQKGKLIILAAHKLIYIGDNIAQCVSAPFLTAEAKKTADRLCCVLKNCVQATKNAADKYPDVSAVQAMVDSIVTVSHAAYDLKLLVKQCC